MARAAKRKTQTIDMNQKSKTPIKLLFACIVFILSFFMMSACSSPEYLEYEGIEPLTKEQMLEIRNEWAEEWYDYTYKVQYNAYVRSNTEERAHKKAKDAAGKAYASNVPQMFRELYADYLYQKTYNDYIETNTEELAQKKAAQKAQQSYEEHLRELFNEDYYYKYRYIGIVNGCVIFMDTYSTEIFEAQLGNIKFLNSLYFLFKDGEFYRVSTAYKKGWLTDKDINTILEKKELFSKVYDEWETPIRYKQRLQ